MVGVAKGSVMQSYIQPVESSSYINGNCVNCVLMNQKYQEAFVELKSFQLINNMLHEEIKTLRSQWKDANFSSRNRLMDSVQVV